MITSFPLLKVSGSNFDLGLAIGRAFSKQNQTYVAELKEGSYPPKESL